MKVELVKHTSDPVLAVENAASVCYDSTPSADGKILKHCYSSGHLSVLEHVSFTFKISGISRNCSHQIVRHRTGKFSQKSQRYCKETVPEYVIPPKIANIPEAKKRFIEYMKHCWGEYNFFLEAGITAEDARFLLPSACETTIFVTFDGRNLLHFMNERLCNCSQWEIKNVALAMKKELEKFDDCKLFADLCVPKCENGKVKYCSEPPSRTCGRQPLAKDINATISLKE